MARGRERAFLNVLPWIMMIQKNIWKLLSGEVEADFEYDQVDQYEEAFM
jgi:hypothetical protein